MDVTQEEMITIPLSEYTELQQARHQTYRDEVQASINAVQTLEDDIDTPLKHIVAMINLLGCSTVWACCGFDYDGQPRHKFHEYGAIYIRIRYSNATLTLVHNLTVKGLGGTWVVTINNVGGVMEVQLKAQFAPTGHLKMWDKVECPHYSEAATFAIYNLERLLLSCQDGFQAQVLVQDTNGLYNRDFKNWQYPPRTPWLVTQQMIKDAFPDAFKKKEGENNDVVVDNTDFEQRQGI